MILGIGIDIIEIGRIREACLKESFRQKIFTPAEILAFGAHIPSLAGNFAGKEAVAKALGCGFRGFGPAEVEILRDKWGKPQVALYGGAKENARQRGVEAIHISISHCQEYAAAYVIMEGESK